MTTKKTTKKVTRTRTTKPVSEVSVTELPVYGMNGKVVSKTALPAEIFGAAWRPDLVHQVATALAANQRQNRAHTKTREEVAGGGKKPWKQKGTGQARHGSTRSPIWRHGGITFGPRVERDYHEKINRKMSTSALYSVLARKAKDGKIILVDSFSFAKPKTKEAVGSLAAISKATGAQLFAKENNAALIALATYEKNSLKSFRNIQNVAVEEARNLNPLSLLSYRYLIIENPKESFKILSSRADARGILRQAQGDVKNIV